MYIKKIKIALVICCFYSFTLLAMKKDSAPSHLEKAFNTTLPINTIERGKAISLLFPSAQRAKYGNSEPSSSLTQEFKNACQKEGEGSIDIKQMNNTTQERCANYGMHIYGSRTLTGKKTVWVDEHYLENLDPDERAVSLKEGIQQTKNIPTDLIQFGANEAVVIAGVLLFSQKARLISNQIKESGIVSPIQYNNLLDLITVQIGSKTYLRPRVYKSAAWLTGTIGTYWALPQSSLESKIYQSHQFRATQQNGNAWASLLGSRPLTHCTIAQDLTDAQKTNIETTVQKTIERQTFNFADCICECNGKECGCKELTSPLNSQLEKIECMQRCHNKQKEYNKFPTRKKNHEN